MIYPGSMRTKFSIGDRFEVVNSDECPTLNPKPKHVGRCGTVVNIAPSVYYECFVFQVLFDDEPGCLYEAFPENMKRLNDCNYQIAMVALSDLIKQYERKRTYWARRINKARIKGDDSLQYFERKFSSVNEQILVFKQAMHACDKRGGFPYEV